MTAPWNGLPDQPERSGWHWIQYIDDPNGRLGWMVNWWDAASREWGDEEYPCTPKFIARIANYGGRALNPSELAQMRKDERERCAGIFDQRARDFIECMKDTTSNLDSLKRAHDEAVAIADKIRALTDDEGEKS